MRERISGSFPPKPGAEAYFKSNIPTRDKTAPLISSSEYRERSWRVYFREVLPQVLLYEAVLADLEACEIRQCDNVLREISAKEVPRCVGIAPDLFGQPVVRVGDHIHPSPPREPVRVAEGRFRLSYHPHCGPSMNKRSRSRNPQVASCFVLAQVQGNQWTSGVVAHGMTDWSNCRMSISCRAPFEEQLLFLLATEVQRTQRKALRANLRGLRVSVVKTILFRPRSSVLRPVRLRPDRRRPSATRLFWLLGSF